MLTTYLLKHARLHETLPEDAIDKENHRLKVDTKWSIEDMVEGRMTVACYSLYFIRFVPILSTSGSRT